MAPLPGIVQGETSARRRRESLAALVTLIMGRAAAFLFLALIGMNGRASDEPADRATLRGLMALKVAVDPAGPELEGEGLHAADLQARIEARLAKAGIAVDQSATVFLGLHVLAVREPKGPYGICLSLGLYQSVFVERDRTIKTATQTWETQSVVVVRPKQVRMAMEGTLDQLVDQFAGAYRSANPK